MSSLGSLDYRHDEWKVDVTVGGSQKGLMLPPGLAFNAISDKAIAASKTSRLPRAYWSWDDMLESNRTGWFPYTPATNLLYGLREALTMLQEEGLKNVFARHRGSARRRGARCAAGASNSCCVDPREYSDAVTAMYVPDGLDADALRATILDRFDMSLGTGLGGSRARSSASATSAINDLMLAGTLCGVQMGLASRDPARDGVSPALAYLSEPRPAPRVRSLPSE